MISDVMFEAIRAIDRYQLDMPDVYDDLWREIQAVKDRMKALQFFLDAFPPDKDAERVHRRNLRKLQRIVFGPWRTPRSKPRIERPKTEEEILAELMEQGHEVTINGKKVSSLDEYRKAFDAVRKRGQVPQTRIVNTRSAPKRAA